MTMRRHLVSPRANQYSHERHIRTVSAKRGLSATANRNQRNVIRSDDGLSSGSRSFITDETQIGFAHSARDIIGIQMKKIILATVLAGLSSTTTLAADLGARAPYAKAPAMVDHLYNWTGLYMGAHAGYGFMKSTDAISGANAAGTAFLVSAGIPTSIPLDPSGFLVGGQFGYNWQVSSAWVLGFEADMSWTDMRKTVAERATNEVSRIMTAREKLDSFGTVRARLGFIPVDRLLVYGTGGLAYGHARLSTALTLVNDGTTVCAGNNCQAGATSDTKVGWTIGAGTEWAFTNNWSLKAEYLYYDLGNLSHTMTDPSFPSIFNAAVQLKGNIVRAGVNYRF
jgi:outer membrane immunogenic protein